MLNGGPDQRLTFVNSGILLTPNGAVLITGGRAPKLVNRGMLSKMKPGAALVNVSFDQGGCFETSRPTTHADPTYKVDGIVHYCVANMPGAVPFSSSEALNNATLPSASYAFDAVRVDRIITNIFAS